MVAAVNASLGRLGADEIDAAAYRRHFLRPLHLFYERLLGSPVDEDLMQGIDDTFQEAYSSGLPGVGLTADARGAVDRVAASGATQSIASMLWHDVLVSTVTRFGLEEQMLALDGHRGSVGETKEAHLRSHVGGLREMYPSISDMVVIGDITDDASAARASGVGCVLYDGGSQERSTLEREGFPVAATLMEAVETALGISARES